MNITKKNVLNVLAIPQLYKHLETTFLPRHSGIRHETRLAKIIDSLSAKGMITYREIEVNETTTKEDGSSETKKVTRKQYMTFEVFEARYQPKILANAVA